LPSFNQSFPVGSFCAVLLAMTVKHFVADFLLQTSWMAHGKERREGWLPPLAVHVLIHAGLTLLIALVVAPRLWWLALIDLVVHFSVDRGKGEIGQRCCWDFTKTQYWWLLGFDQFIHQVTNIAITAAFFVL
jgi:hypothetical protein